MSKTHEGCVRGFTHWSEAWYSKVPGAGRTNTDDELMVGMYHPHGGTSGEFAIRWVQLSGRSVPKLEVFDDAWNALRMFDDVLQWMSTVDGEKVTPQLFAAALRRMGVADMTRRENPYVDAGELEYRSWMVGSAA